MKRLLWPCLLCLVSPAAAEQPLPVYPGAVHTRIGADLVIGGERYRVAYFTTGDPMEQVARHFRRRWVEQGYPVTLEGDLRREAIVSAFDTRAGLQRAVVLRTHQGSTVGLSVLKDLWRPERAGPPGPAALEGALYSADVAWRGEQGETEHRTTLVARPLEDVRRELAGRWSGAGFQVVRHRAVSEGGKAQQVVELTDGRRRLVATLVELDADHVAVAQTTLRTEIAP